ncbi:MAG: twin-arginine translocase TatA/TatE family subunit [Chlorobi bacterium]|nr:twin-arginine translocase TatA/TatE family subunit [Chlorobiota bacterium]
MVSYTCGWIGGYELILILVVVLLLFGGRKLPELARGIGKGIRDFRKATEENDLAKDIKDVASEINEVKKSVTSEIKEVKKDVENLNPKNAFNVKDTTAQEKKPEKKPEKESEKEK